MRVWKTYLCPREHVVFGACEADGFMYLEGKPACFRCALPMGQLALSVGEQVSPSHSDSLCINQSVAENHPETEHHPALLCVYLCALTCDFPVSSCQDVKLDLLWFARRTMFLLSFLSSRGGMWWQG